MNYEAIARIKRAVTEEVVRTEEAMKKHSDWLSGLKDGYPCLDYHSRRLGEMQEAVEQMREFVSAFDDEKWRQIKGEFANKEKT